MKFIKWKLYETYLSNIQDRTHARAITGLEVIDHGGAIYCLVMI